MFRLTAFLFAYSIVFGLAKCNAQETQEASASEESATSTYFLQVDYMQVPDGGDDLYVKVENLWKELHEVRRDLGIIRAWAMCRVKRTTGPEADYNYVTLHLFDSWAKIENSFPWNEISAKLSEPTEEENEILEKTSESRDIVDVQLWALEDTAMPSRWGKSTFDRTIRLGFMKSKDPQRHRELETEIWKKAWAQAAKDGIRWDWQLWGRRFPGGSKHPFDLVAVHLFPQGEPGKTVPEDWWDKAALKVFPEKSREEIEQLFEPTADVRTIPIQEEWEILEYVEMVD
jgi:hypothetical protein